MPRLHRLCILSFEKIINVPWIRWWCTSWKWMGFHSPFRRRRSLCYYGSAWMQWPLTAPRQFPWYLQQLPPISCADLMDERWNKSSEHEQPCSSAVITPVFQLGLRSSYYLIFTCYLFIILDMGLLVYGNYKMHPCLFGSMYCFFLLCIVSY